MTQLLDKQSTLLTKGYAASEAGAPLAPFSFRRREPAADDVVIDIKYCGICHSDIHQTRDEWGGSTFPMVPGHEIAGVVSQIGTAVTKFKVGDHVGIGCFVDSGRSEGTARERGRAISAWSRLHVQFDRQGRVADDGRLFG